MSATPWSVEGILALRHRENRELDQAHFVDGVRFVVTAADAGATILSLIVSPKLLRSPLGQMLARRLRARGVPSLSVSPAEFARVSQAEDPQGVGAVLAQKWESLDSQVPLPRDCWVALGEVRSPGNLGTLMRTAAACGARGIIVPRAGSADPYHPATTRAAMGALVSLRLVRASCEQLEAWKRHNGLTIVGATPNTDVDYRAVSYRRPVVLLLGSERKGLTDAQLALCDARVRIPMVGGDSLNLAVAGSVLLYEVWGQRRPVRRAW